MVTHSGAEIMLRSPKQALFLHIQKTAGTSIMEMARKRYGISGVISHADFMHLGREGCSRYPFVSGHFGYDFAEPLRKDRYAFTFLRDPIERLISLYWFSRAATGDNILYDAARQYSFDDFLRLGLRVGGQEPHPLRPQLWNNQTYQLAHGYGSAVGIDAHEPYALLAKAKLNLCKLDFVGFTETFVTDSHEIFRDLDGSTKIPEFRANITIDRPSVYELPDTTISLLIEMTKLDRQLYGFAKEARCAHRTRHFDSTQAC